MVFPWFSNELLRSGTSGKRVEGDISLTQLFARRWATPFGRWGCRGYWTKGKTLGIFGESLGQQNWLAVTGTWLLWISRNIGNVIIPNDFHIFQRDWNHQPDKFSTCWDILNFAGWSSFPTEVCWLWNRSCGFRIAKASSKNSSSTPSGDDAVLHIGSETVSGYWRTWD